MVAVAAYVAEIDAYDRKAANWRLRSKKIIERYRDERPANSDGVTLGARMNMLWSNVQTLQPALYARNPKPDIAQRWKDEDPLSRIAAQVLERSTSYFTDNDAFGATNRQAVLDYLLPGRGSTWVRYVPTLEDAPQIGNDEGSSPAPENPEGQTTDDADVPQVVKFEDVKIDYVHYEDFGHNVARTWEEVYLVWRRTFMTQAQLKERFGDKAVGVPLDRKPSGDTSEGSERASKATIFECWDSRDRQVRWLHKDMPEWLDERADMLRLDDFFPCPRPLLANTANDCLIPTPDYIQYQDQAVEIDDLTARISNLTAAVKVAGVYDASAPALARLLNDGVENVLLPVEQWAAFADKGGMNGAVSFMPLRDTVEALLRLYEARSQVKQDLYEVTGISDIIRGQTSPNETATAQQLKSQFANLRLSDRQQEVQRFCRDTVRLIAQVIAGHFQIATIKEISGLKLFETAKEKAMVQQQIAQAQAQAQGQPVPPPPEELQRMLVDPAWDEVEKLIRDNATRSFKIDIETDSTIKSDEQQEKADRIEFLGAATQFLQQIPLLKEQAPELLPLAGQMLLFGVRAFPVGKEMESTFQAAITSFEKEAKNPTQKPDPEAAKMQAEQQKAQMEAQAAAQEAQTEAALEQQRIAADRDKEIARATADVEIERVKQQGQAQKDAADRELDVLKHREKLETDAATAIEQERLRAISNTIVGRIKANMQAATASAKAKSDG